MARRRGATLGTREWRSPSGVSVRLVDRGHRHLIGGRTESTWLIVLERGDERRPISGTGRCEGEVVAFNEVFIFRSTNGDIGVRALSLRDPLTNAQILELARARFADRVDTSVMHSVTNAGVGMVVIRFHLHDGTTIAQRYGLFTGDELGKD